MNYIDSRRLKTAYMTLGWAYICLLAGFLWISTLVGLILIPIGLYKAYTASTIQGLNKPLKTFYALNWVKYVVGAITIPLVVVFLGLMLFLAMVQNVGFAFKVVSSLPNEIVKEFRAEAIDEDDDDEAVEVSFYNVYDEDNATPRVTHRSHDSELDELKSDVKTYKHELKQASNVMAVFVILFLMGMTAIYFLQFRESHRGSKALPSSGLTTVTVALIIQASLMAICSVGILIAWIIDSATIGFLMSCIFMLTFPIGWILKAIGFFIASSQVKFLGNIDTIDCPRWQWVENPQPTQSIPTPPTVDSESTPTPPPFNGSES